MKRIRLAYRDNDRTPVIFCIKEMAERHYDLEVEVIRIPGTEEYEAALFNDSCDIIVEHLEYLYAEVGKRKKVTMFCAPRIKRGLDLVAPPHVDRVEELKGKTMAVRSSGRPHTVTLWLRMMGMEKDVRTIIVTDHEVGRWGQWKKVVSGECIATFMDPLYLPEALSAGLKVLPVPDLEIVGYYSQASLATFVKDNHSLLGDYVKAVIHALCLMTLKKDEALEIVSREPMKLMKITDLKELERQFDCIVKGLQSRPYPTVESIANTYEIATLEYGAKDINPLTLWDLHWVKELDDEGFIDSLIGQLSSGTRS